MSIKNALLPILTVGLTAGVILLSSPLVSASPTNPVNPVNPTNIDTIVSQQSDEAVIAKLQANLSKAGIEATIVSAQRIGASDLYWIQSTDVPAFFVDSKANYVIQGQLVGIGTGKPIDISSALTDNLSKEQLEAVHIDDMIVYPATTNGGKAKAVIYVFTDANCPYCKKLHSDMDTLNDMGIEVRYLAWPRSPQDLALNEAIWCSEDRVQALNQAKKGIPPPMQTCNSPVVSQVELGNALGVEGTPAIFTESGALIGGYLTPKDFADILQLKSVK